MKKDSLRIYDYLDHIQQAIQRIYRFTESMTETEFLDSEQVQDAVLRNIEIIGEAAKKIETGFPEYAAKHSDVPWADVYLMRNRISHGYFSVDLEIVWKTVQRDIPELERLIRPLRSSCRQAG